MIPFNIIMTLGLSLNLIYMPALILQSIKKIKSILDPNTNDSYCVVSIWILWFIIIQSLSLILQNSVYLMLIIDQPDTEIKFHFIGSSPRDRINQFTVPMVYFQTDLIQML